MATPKVYVICDQNCKFESMTKEQILAAILQAVNEGTIGDIDAGFITTIKTINGQSLKFFIGEQSAYDALSDKEKENLFPIITNDDTISGINEAIEELLLNYKELSKETNKAPKLYGGAKMPRYSDFNKYVENGTYTTGDNADTRTLYNRPSDNAGTLIVMAGTGDNDTAQDWYSRVQIYVGHSANYICFRNIIQSGGEFEFTPWKEISGRRVLWSGSMTAPRTDNGGVANAYFIDVNLLNKRIFFEINGEYYTPAVKVLDKGNAAAAYNLPLYGTTDGNAAPVFYFAWRIENGDNKITLSVAGRSAVTVTKIIEELE